MTAAQRSPDLQRLSELVHSIRTRDYALPKASAITQTRRRDGRLLDTQTREYDIRDWIDLAQKLGKKGELALANATLIAEIARHRPLDALKLYEKIQVQFKGSIHARLIALWGLSVACESLGRTVQAHQHRAHVERLSEDLSEEEDRGWRELARIPGEINAARPSTDIPRVSLASLDRIQADIGWLAHKRVMSLRETGAAFGGFMTADKKFISGAAESAAVLSKRLALGLKKPANYLLDAAPG